MNNDPPRHHPAFRRRRFPHDHGTIAAIELGPETAPLGAVFLHANGFNALTYRSILAEAAPGTRTLAIDLRGHGLTDLPVPDPHPGWRLYAADLLSLLAGLGEQPRLLAGHSMGASICLLALPALPAPLPLLLFEPVIVTLPPAKPPAPVWDQPLAQAALRRKADFPSRQAALAAYQGRGAFRTWPDAALADYLTDGLRDTPDGAVTLACRPAWEAANFATYTLADPLQAAARATAPIRIFRAEHNSTCALTEPLTPAMTIETVPGTTHFLPMERPISLSLPAA